MEQHEIDPKAALKAALDTFAGEKDENIAQRIRPIVFRNLSLNRFSPPPTHTLKEASEYVYRVAEHYEKFAPYVHKLQVEKDEAAWQELMNQLVLWAYNFFVRKNFAQDQQTLLLAQARAQEAGMAILQAHFPYDTDFMPWARVIITNKCRRFMRTEMRREKNLPQASEDIGSFEERIRDPKVLMQQDQTELRQELLDAIGKLGAERQILVLMYYIEGMSLKEIAASMEKSMSAIYSLHHRALADLRQILQAGGNSDE